MNATPFLYQYGVGGLVFFVGLYLGWKAGYVGLRTASQKRNLFIVVGGLLVLMGLQGFMQFIAPGMPHNPVKGEPLPTLSVGTSLDYGIMIGYFLVILALGTWFGRYNKSTRDFFFGGQKFSWWFITMSLVATTVGSYSFIKYSRVAYNYGLSSSQTYLNDWFWVPLFLFGWLPIIFFSKVVSIPEYFDRRFGTAARAMVTGLLLIYLIGYVGINLYTMGTALEALLGWDVFTAACVVACISAVYVTWGGQTSVIVTDLFQGFMLLLAGGLILYFGIEALGGFGDFWSTLKPEHRMAFSDFNADASFPMVGIFWQDAMANTAVFYFLNQGVIMRFLSVKSVNEGKKAVTATAIILMPIAAMVVASGGWVGSAMETAGLFDFQGHADHVFVKVAQVLCSPGFFGLVMAALTAALMSTVDTLITAVAAIGVNDVWRPYLKPGQTDAYYLKIARYTSIAVALIGIALVPVFAQFDSIYSAHGAFTAAVTPPLVVALLLAILWPRFTPKAAVATLGGGFACVLFSVWYPEVIDPFAHGVSRFMEDGSELTGAKAHKFMRAFYGIVVSGAIGIIVSLFTKPKSMEEIEGLTQASSQHFAWKQMGRKVDLYTAPPRTGAEVLMVQADNIDESDGTPWIRLSQSGLEALDVNPGDPLLVSDPRWWFGGLRSMHAKVGASKLEAEGIAIELGPIFAKRVVGKATQVVVERLL